MEKSSKEFFDGLRVKIAELEAAGKPKAAAKLKATYKVRDEAVPADPERVRTVVCRKLVCKETFTGPVSKLAGWACPEHKAEFAKVDKAKKAAAKKAAKATKK